MVLLLMIAEPKTTDVPTSFKRRFPAFFDAEKGWYAVFKAYEFDKRRAERQAILKKNA